MNVSSIANHIAQTHNNSKVLCGSFYKLHINFIRNMTLDGSEFIFTQFLFFDKFNLLCCLA